MLNSQENPVLIEVCLDSVQSAVNAQEGGAGRVELCDNLFEGGTTPSIGTIRLAREKLAIQLNVIIRPRGGDFLYSDLEYRVMQEDIDAAKQAGADGVVLGMLTPEGRVDRERTSRLVQQARPMSVTFHRAFDAAGDPFDALEDIIETGCDRILTSGQEETVTEGQDCIAELLQRAQGRISIMPGNGITERNFDKIHRRLLAKEYHVLADKESESGMTYRSAHVFMGGVLRPPEFALRTTDTDRIRQIACRQESGE